jgi:hypothetical protein
LSCWYACSQTHLAFIAGASVFMVVSAGRFETLYLLACGTPFVDEPHLLARLALHANIEHSMFMTVGHPNTAGGKEACQPAFRVTTPDDLFPFFLCQH